MRQALLAAAQDRLPEMLADIERLITLETPSHDHAAVARGAADIAELIHERLGMRPHIVERDGVTHLRLRFTASSNPCDNPAARVVLLCHQDTVWPHGTLDLLPFSATDGILRGPGSFDMLTGLVMAIHAVAILQEDGMPTAGISLLVTGDEEVGSPTSRDLIGEEVGSPTSRDLIGEEVSRNEDPPAVLVLEASADGGAVKVGRKGASSYRITVHGRAAHAGLEPQNGINAGVELAHQLLRIVELADDDAGTSVVATTLAGGSSNNTVPATAYLDVDSRAWTTGEQHRVDTALQSLSPTLDGARIEVSGGINRPPLQREHSMGLYAVLAQVCEELDLSTPEAADVGGASDGNITAGLGAPTLDGLGALGAGAHADHEHALIEPIPERTAMLTALIHRVLGDHSAEERATT